MVSYVNFRGVKKNLLDVDDDTTRQCPRTLCTRTKSVAGRKRTCFGIGSGQFPWTARGHKNAVYARGGKKNETKQNRRDHHPPRRRVAVPMTLHDGVPHTSIPPRNAVFITVTTAVSGLLRFRRTTTLLLSLRPSSLKLSHVNKTRKTSKLNLLLGNNIPFVSSGPAGLSRFVSVTGLSAPPPGVRRVVNVDKYVYTINDIKSSDEGRSGRFFFVHSKHRKGCCAVDACLRYFRLRVFGFFSPRKFYGFTVNLSKPKTTPTACRQYRRLKTTDGLSK